MEIVLLKYDTALSISYDEYHRPRRGFFVRWIGDLKFKKPPCQPYLGEALRRGPSYRDDFHGLGVNRIDSCLFLQSRHMRFSLIKGQPDQAIVLNVTYVIIGYYNQRMV